MTASSHKEPAVTVAQRWGQFLTTTGTIIFGTVASVWAVMVYALDDRYVKHEDLSAAVVEIKTTIQRSARQVQCEALLDDIQRLEQTIAFKARNGEDSALEQIILESDKRKLNTYGGCQQ